MFTKTIGILGGMGPVASADTYVELIKICQQKYGAVQDSDFPAVILYSLPLADFDNKGFSNDQSEQKTVVSQLVGALKKLEISGAEVIVIDCNTVHHFFDELQKSTYIPIINLIATTVEYVVKAGYHKVGVLCSQASKNVGLYTRPLEKLNIEVLNLSQNDQDFINKAILAVMSGRVTSEHVIKLTSLMDQLLLDGAESIILGCTEISNLAKQLNHHATLIDSEALAVEKVLRPFAK